jgi:hypothetical protein
VQVPGDDYVILHGAVADNAWAFYADEVRRDPTNVYLCSKLLHQSHRFGGTTDGEALLRAAALTLYKVDPFAYVTSMPGSIRVLTDDDLSEISSGLDRAGDENTTNFLRGMLWSDVVRWRKDPAAVARRAISYLEQVSNDAAAREPDYWPAVAECYRVIDYSKYVQVLPRAFASQEPERRGYCLLHGLEEAIGHEDWKTYSEWRDLWDALPQNAHVCECYLNHVLTYDGLMALHHEKLSVIPDLLRRALEIRGCPHLNSFGPDMGLTNALIDRGILLDEAEAYVNSGARLFGENDRLPPLRERLVEARSRIHMS